MYIAKQNVKGHDYYYLRKSVRKGSKVISENVAYLGKDKTEAEKKATGIIKKLNNRSDDMSEEKKLIHKKLTIEELAKFCKEKGFVFQNSEIYGGMAGFWDYGPRGSELKKNLKEAWWKYHVHGRDDIVGIDGSIITHPKVWEASGHVDSFVDVAVVCKNCNNKSKVDRHELGIVKCEKCSGEFESKGEFNPMFTTQVGPIKDDSTTSYLRPETAQVIFVDFKQVLDTSRKKLPFGIAQIGKAFRNEIAPRDFIFRCREFEQMEIEYFIDEDKIKDCPFLEEVLDLEWRVYTEQMQKEGSEAQKMTVKEALDRKLIKIPWHAYWLATELKWFYSLGVNSDNFRIRQHVSEEKSHYATDTWDLEYNFPMGWKELQGMANRGNYDLSQHEKHSKKELKVYDEEKKEKVLPIVVSEPSQGVERAFAVFMLDAFHENEKGDSVLKISPKLAPVKAAVFPLVKREEFEKIAKGIVEDLRKNFNINYDKSGSIGRRYARNDEIGTPFCITVDGDSPKDKAVTIRDRDTTEQKRIKISEIKSFLNQLIDGDLNFSDL